MGGGGVGLFNVVGHEKKGDGLINIGFIGPTPTFKVK